MKVYLYYQEGSIYAYTNDKDIKNKFEENRNLDILTRKTVNMSKKEHI